MKRNLLLMGLYGLTALTYNNLSATLGGIVDSAVNTAEHVVGKAGDVVESVVEPTTTQKVVIIEEEKVVNGNGAPQKAALYNNSTMNKREIKEESRTTTNSCANGRCGTRKSCSSCNR